MAITVTIDGEAVCVYGPQGQLQLSVQESLNGRATAQLRIQDLNGTYEDNQPGGFQFKEIVAMDGTDKVFAGIITNQRNSTEQGLQDYHYIDLRATDWTILLDRRRVFGVFEKGEFVTTIVSTLLDQKAPGGTDSASSDGVTRANVGGALQIDSRLIIEGATIAQALDEISKLVGAHWYVDWDKDIHMSTTGVSAPFAINDALGSCTFASIWSEQTTERYRNTQRVRRDFSSVPESIRVFAANGSDRTFYVALQLAEAPTVIRRTATYAETSVGFSPTGNAADGDTITMDGVTYTFHSALAAANDVLIGSTSAETTRNLSYAINNQATWEGELYHADTAIHPTCEAAYETGHLIWVRFREISTGNGTAISKSCAAITLGASTLTGAGPGENETASVGEFGTTVSGSDWYWKAGSTAIKQDDAAATPVNGEYIEVRYKPLFANWAAAYDMTEVAAKGRWESAEDENANSDGTISKSVAEAFLRRYGVIPTSFQYVMYAEKEPLVNQLVSGMAQSVTAPCVGIPTATALITGVSRNWRFTYWQGVGTWRTSNNITGVIYPGSATDEPWSSWLEFFAPKGTGTITGGGGTGGSGTTSPTTNYPGPIRDFQLQPSATVDTTTEPGIAIIPLQYQQPTAVNGFSRIKLWITADGVDTIDAGEIPHELGVTGIQTFTVRFPLLGIDLDNAILWGASGSASYTNGLVTSGAGETPSFGIGDLPAYTVGAPAAPEVPLGAALAILDRGANFALQVTITPPSTMGGTAGYEREVRYWNDSGLTTPDSDWIELGFVDTASTVSISGPWPRPGYNQWVKCRVRSINWDGVSTAWVESSTAQALTPLALPPAIAANGSTVVTEDGNGYSKFGFNVSITPNASPGTTTDYIAQARYWNDSGLTDPDSDWIDLGGFPFGQNTLGTSLWDRPPAQQWAKVRVAAVNAGNKIGSWVESASLVIPAFATGPNITSITATAFANGEEGWGVDWVVGLPSDRSKFQVLRLYIVQPAINMREVMAGPIVPLSGTLTGTTDGRWPRPETTETYQIESEAIDIYGNKLPTITSATFTIGPWAWQQVTLGTATLDYAATQGEVRVTLPITSPADPELKYVRLYEKRGSEGPREIGLFPVTPSATVSADFAVSLPVGSADTVDVYAVPVHENGSTEALRTSTSAHPKVTITADPASQAPASSYEGFDRYVLSSNPTLTKAPAAGKIYYVVIVQDGTGGRIPTFDSGDFANASLIPAPNLNPAAITTYSFFGDDVDGAGVKWNINGWYSHV